VFLIIGLAALFIFAGLDYKIWLVLTDLSTLSSRLFLILVFVTGAARFGAARWLTIGTEAIQPANWRKSLLLWRWRNSSQVKLPTSMNGRPSARACC
jgi:cell division protein FtsW (lipid II flippase)